MQDVIDYVVMRKYKGKTIEVKVRDYNKNGTRLTTIACEYNPNVIGFRNGTDEQVDYYIRTQFWLAKKYIDENSFVKKLGKLFR